ncbi:MAG: hypothetical protein HY880_09690 [Deltaproteobacteria bacterium]|nr:hypothetical protein [Deltaproteobacteria bacterium]
MKVFSSLLFLLLFAGFAFAETIPADKPDINQSYGKLPLYFIKNDGQVDSKVLYYEKGSGHATYFTKEGVFLSLINPPASRRGTQAKFGSASRQREPSPLKKGGFESDTPSPFGGEGRGERAVASESIKLSFINANENPEIIALDEQAGKVNYLIGNDQSKWKTNIPTYSSVLYKDVYNGIDIKFYGNNQQLEYDVIVKPGADPNIVKFSYDGIEGLSVNEKGDLEISLKQGKIIQKKPYVYQEIDGKRKEVEGRFVITPKPFTMHLSQFTIHDSQFTILLLLCPRVL